MLHWSIILLLFVLAFSDTLIFTMYLDILLVYIWVCSENLCDLIIPCMMYVLHVSKKIGPRHGWVQLRHAALMCSAWSALGCRHGWILYSQAHRSQWCWCWFPRSWSAVVETRRSEEEEEVHLPPPTHACPPNKQTNQPTWKCSFHRQLPHQASTKDRWCLEGASNSPSPVVDTQGMLMCGPVFPCSLASEVAVRKEDNYSRQLQENVKILCSYTLDRAITSIMTTIHHTSHKL